MRKVSASPRGGPPVRPRRPLGHRTGPADGLCVRACVCVCACACARVCDRGGSDAGLQHAARGTSRTGSLGSVCPHGHRSLLTRRTSGFALRDFRMRGTAPPPVVASPCFPPHGAPRVCWALAPGWFPSSRLHVRARARGLGSSLTSLTQRDALCVRPSCHKWQNVDFFNE